MPSSHRSIAHIGAAVVGVAYLAIGVVGFAVTGVGAFVQDTVSSRPRVNRKWSMCAPAPPP